MAWRIALVAATAGCLTRPSPLGGDGGRPGHVDSDRSADALATDADLTFRHVGVFQDMQKSAASFTAAAHHAGDAVVFHLSCDADVEPAISIQAPTSWNAIEVARGGAQANWAVAYGAIAPDTNAATFAVFVPSDCGTTGSYLVADEFTNNDPTGGTTTFDGAGITGGGGDCFVTATTGHADDAVWAACTASMGIITGATNGYTMGASGSVAASEYQTTNAPTTTLESLVFNGTVSSAVASCITIKTL